MNSFRPRVYIDTSVIGGCFDEEFKEYSLQLFDEFISGRKKLVISDVLLFKLEEAPQQVKSALTRVPSDNIEYVSLNEESITLANAYLKEGVVAQRVVFQTHAIWQLRQWSEWIFW